MPLYRREGSPFWQYSFAVNGVRFRGSTGCTGKREAQLVEAAKRHEAKARRKRSDPWRLRDCLGAYWSEHAKNRGCADDIFAKLEALSRIIGKDRMIADLTNADMLDYRAARVAEGLTPHGVNRDFAYLAAALKWAQTMHGKQVPALAWKQIKVAEPPHRIRYLSRDEYARLLAACPSPLALIVKCAVATGLRKNNILKMDWREVDLSSGLITVTVKGNKQHRVKMPPPLRAALSTLPHRKGRVFDTRSVRYTWEKAVAEAELEDFRFHDLRHTAATWMRMAGADLADICEALGHSSVAVTMRYAHIEPEHHVTAFDRISDRVWSQSASQSVEKASRINARQQD